MLECHSKSPSNQIHLRHSTGLYGTIHFDLLSPCGAPPAIPEFPLHCTRMSTTILYYMLCPLHPLQYSTIHFNLLTPCGAPSAIPESPLHCTRMSLRFRSPERWASKKSSAASSAAE